MHALSSLLVLGTCAVQSVLGRPDAALRSKREAAIVKRSVDDFIETETPIAWNKLLCNIGPDGCAASGAGLGVVIASPSKSEPDYWYTWSRDAALVMTGLVDAFAHNYSASLQTTIHNFVISQAKLQAVGNPSGGLADGAGLGEPKFNVDLSQFTGEWGRPQRDGPPLRAIALTRYAKWLVANGYKDTATSVVWPVIKNDLAYTAQYWNETGFDLWEEVPGSSFFTIASSHRALVEGAALAAQLGTECRACLTTAPQVLCFQQSFWKANGGHIVSNINGGEYRSGIDANSILVSAHNFDPAAGCDSNTFQPCSERALSNHKAYVDSFRSEYSINAGIPQGQAVAVGRYSEDVYYNGNPWYLTNFAAAEQLYDAIHVWKAQASITITPLSLPFFRDLLPSITTGTHPSTSPTYTSLLAAVSTYADGFLAIAAQYAGADGALAEQYDRNNGSPASATHLTWSYAAFLSATDRRAGIVPLGWSAEEGNTLPSTCEHVQVAGTYAAATVTAFPPNLTPNPAAAPAPVPFPGGGCASQEEVYVTFNERVVTEWGDSVKVVGSAPELGAWDVSKAVGMSASGYSGARPVWSITVPIARREGGQVAYKYVRVKAGGEVVWEADPNRSLTLAVAGAGVKKRECDGEGGGGGEEPVGACAAMKVDDVWR